MKGGTDPWTTIGDTERNAFMSTTTADGAGGSRLRGYEPEAEKVGYELLKIMFLPEMDKNFIEKATLCYNRRAMNRNITCFEKSTH